MNWWLLRRKIHSSWLVGVASAGTVCGVIGVQYVPSGWFVSWTWLLVALSLLALCFWSRWVVAVVFAVLAGGLLGMWRGAVLAHDSAPYGRLVGHLVEVDAFVKEDADRDKKGALVIQLTQVNIASHTLPGVMRVTLGSDADIKRGDRVVVRGKMANGFGGISGTMYRATLMRAQRPEPGDVARQVRDTFADTVRRFIDEPAASLGLGYLLGQRHGLPDTLSTALQVAGLTHVVVASGYNLTILVRLARRLFMGVSKYFATLCAGSLTVGFMAITGMGPSMMRAGLITGLSLLAWYYGRRFHPLVLLPFAAAVTLLVDPTYGWGNLGWQLSFAAFAGVMVLAPLLQRYLFGEQKPGIVVQILLETLAAFLVTLPILLVAFGKASNVAVLANILVLPFIPLAMLLVFACGLAALILPFAAGVVGSIASWLLNYMVWVATTLAALPWAQTELTVTPLVAAGCYGALLGACIYMSRVTRSSLRDANLVE